MIKKKDNLLRVIHHDRPQWVPNGMEGTVWIGHPVTERPAQAGRDAFGVLWGFEEGARGGTYPEHGGHVISDLATWREQLILPDLEKADWQPVRDKSAGVDRDESLIVGFVQIGLFERSYLLLGMEEALMAYMTEPGLMSELLTVLPDYKIALIEKFDDLADLDIIWYGDDWGTQNSLFLPPEVWRKVVKPQTQRVYDCMKARGILINQHSCGKVAKLVADMVEMGAAIWNPCQPCSDLAGLKERFAGRLAFCGGIDSQFVLDRPGVTTEEVRAEVRRRIDELADGGGYIAAPSHHVPYDPAIAEAMNDEIERYGRDLYTKERTIS